MKRCINKSLIIIALISFVFLSGCALLFEDKAKTAGDENFKYIPGEFSRGVLEKKVESSVLNVYHVSMIVLKDLGIAIDQETHGIRSAKIRAKYYDGKSLKIDVDAIASFESKISIQIGVEGDSKVSEDILTAIMKAL
ncbi:MAG: DUF3568 family protein [Candidatus Zapsychrus exili]|nr:DUF3568 family protein [Candidatus Zapsychrus exili]